MAPQPQAARKGSSFPLPITPAHKAGFFALLTLILIFAIFRISKPRLRDDRLKVMARSRNFWLAGATPNILGFPMFFAEILTLNWA
jgi:hypothetical protein